MGGTLTVAVEAETASPWTPGAVQCASSCHMRARTFYDPLVTVGTDLEVHPWLLESVESNDTATEWTLKVREGIKFHDGTDLDGAAVIDNLKRNATSILLKGALRDLAKEADGSLKVETVDDMTFKLFTGHLGDINDPVSWYLFPYALGTQFGFMASPTWLAAVDDGSAQATDAVGTGPFILESFAPGDTLVVKKNPNYWAKDKDGNALPYLDSIEFRVITDAQNMQKALESGEIDMIASSDANVLKPLSTSDFTYVAQDDYSEVNYVLFAVANDNQPALQSKEVRCALLQAVDKQQIIDATASGFLEPATGMMSKGQEGYLDDNGAPGYDPEAAKAAIEAYEAANGPVEINYSTTTSASTLNTAQYLQGVWGSIGVDVTIDQIEQSKLITNALLGDPAFEAFGWRNHAGFFADQQNYWWSSEVIDSLSLNFGRLQDPVIDDLLAQIREEADATKRKAIAEDLNRQFGKECWTIPTSFTKWGIFSSKQVKGYGRLPTADGASIVRDGAGFPGQVWLHTVFKVAG